MHFHFTRLSYTVQKGICEDGIKIELRWVLDSFESFTSCPMNVTFPVSQQRSVCVKGLYLNVGPLSIKENTFCAIET